MTLLEEAYALTTAYVKVYPSPRETLYEHISECPVVSVGDSDREKAQVPKDKRFLGDAAYIESLSSVVVLMIAMSQPWVWGLAREGKDVSQLGPCPPPSLVE